jgi:NADP-dependent alcohol dehydrogenase
MWCATMALSGVIGAGVPQDWSTHMIGHELTAIYGIDHARTLAIVLPSMMWSMRKEKFVRLKQYGERIWNIQVNNDDDVRKVIDATASFFREMGLGTTLKDYKVGEEAIVKVTSRLEARGFQPMGETQSVTLEKVAEVLKGALA